jgi:hypothetical protein
MRKLLLCFVVTFGIAGTLVGCAVEPPMHALAPYSHPPAALDMQGGDCMTPPCGPGHVPQSGFRW